MMKVGPVMVIALAALCGTPQASMVVADDGRIGMTVLMVTGEAAPARIAGDFCVIQSPRVSHADFNRGPGGPAADDLIHLGASARACISGDATPLEDAIPANTTQHRVLLGAYMRCETGAPTCSWRKLEKPSRFSTVEDRENWRAGRRIWKSWRSGS